jgi:hypothetical protein
MQWPATMKSVMKNEAVRPAQTGRAAFWCLLALMLSICSLWPQAGQASTYTQGAKKVLFIKVDFPDKPGDPIPDANAKALIQQVFDYFKDSSYGTTTLAKVDVTPLLRLKSNSTVYEGNHTLLLVEARTLAATAGFDHRQYDFDIVGFTGIKYTWAGLGYVGAPGSWLNGYFDLRVTGHELGHNLGLSHANFYETNDGNPIGNGIVDEYGDVFDLMGGGGSAAHHFNTWYKNLLDWIPSSGVKTVTASGTYRIQEHDNPAADGIRALKLTKDGTKNYWVEYRQKINNIWLQNGATIRWGYNRNTASDLLDMSPESVQGGGDVNDAALVIGRTFSDPTAKVHITPVKKIDGAVKELEFNVNLGDFPTNSAPQVKLSADRTSTLPGTNVTLTAQSTDPDGDALAYYWDFGDRTIGPNAATAVHSWAVNGTYAVRCVVSDMKGKTGSASIVIKVNDPNSLSISGRVLSDCGSPLEGAKVRISDTQGALTSSDGTYVIVGVKQGSYTVTTTYQGNTVNPANFTNPVNVQGDVLNINFGAQEPDSVAPTLAIIEPLDGSIVANLSSMGIAQDVGCGIERINIDIQRESDDKHWNGTTWVDGDGNLAVAINGNVWSKTTGLPDDNNLPAGDYHITVTAFDKNRNSTKDEVSVTVPEAPTISITTPGNSSLQSSLPRVAGTAASGTNDPISVQFSLHRLNDNKYFNGSGFVLIDPLGPAPLMDAVYNVTTKTWERTSGLPTSTQLKSGTYRITATATTQIGRRASTSATFLVDRDGPSVAFTRPVSNGFADLLSSVKGTAIDNANLPGASGIARVNLFIQRNSDGKWWTGSGWGAKTALPTALSDQQFAAGGGSAWAAPAGNVNLPGASQTVPGTYTLQATALDKAGNEGSASILVTVDTGAPTVEITTPKNNSNVTVLDTTGIARDGGSGVDNVKLIVQRDSDGQYWDGTKWTGPVPVDNTPFPGAALMVGSYNSGTVRQFGMDGAAQGTFASSLSNPESILYGKDLNGDGYPELFVAERSRHRVRFYDGKTKTQLGVFTGGGLLSPTGLAFMPNGDLLVATGHGESSKGAFLNYPTSVKRYDVRTRAYLGDFVLPNSGGVTNGFEGMCWGNDANGDGVQDLYVAALFDAKVPVYSGVDGTYIRDFVAPSAGNLRFTTDVTFGPDNTGDGVSDCYVASSGTDAIKLYDGVTGAFVRDFVADRDGATVGLNGPERALFGPDGNLYVSSFGTPNANAGSGSAVLRFNGKTGAPMPAVGQSKAFFATGDLNGPAGLAFNPVATGQVTPPPPSNATIIPTLTTTYSEVNGVFARGNGMPTGDNLKPGRYTIKATATDRGGKTASHTVSVVVGSVPVVRITTPASGATVSTLPKVNGEVTSAVGVSKVLLYLQRKSDNLYWTGSAWGAKTALSTTLTTTTTGAKFERASGLPAEGKLTAGGYRVEAVATDKANLTGTAVSEFTVSTSGGGGGGTSTVTVSQSSASVSISGVKLVFTGALDASTAIVPGNYLVTVNGVAVPVESVSYSASNFSVLLRLPANTLRSGNTVQVTYSNLKDTTGKTVSGKTDAFAATA